MVPVNYLAVFAAAVSSMIIGSLWYGPIFGKKWMALSGISMGSGKPSGMGKSYALMFVGSLVTAYALSHFLVFASAYMNASGASAGIMAGFWAWLGFIAPVTLGSVLWERKPWSLWVLNNAYRRLSLLVAGVILALWL